MRIQHGFGKPELPPVPPSLPQTKLASHEAVTVVENVLQELLRGILTPERAQSPVDAYLTEEDLFHHRNPRVQAPRGPGPWCGPREKIIANRLSARTCSEHP